MIALTLRNSIGDIRHLAVLGVGAVALFLALFFSAQAGLLFLAAAWLAVGVWRFPWPAFLLLVAAAPFLPILKATVILGPLTLLKDVVILTLGLRVFTRKERGRIAPALLPPVLFFAAWSLVSFARADAPVLGLLRLRDLLLYVLLFPVGAWLVDSAARRRTFLHVFLASGALVLSLAVLQWLVAADGMVLRFDAVRSVWVPRSASVLAHPNILGGYLVFLLPLSAAVALTSGFAAPQRRHSALERAGGVLLALGSAVAAYATYSRSAWLALGASVAVGSVLLVRARRRHAVWALLLVAVLGAGVIRASPRALGVLRSALDPAYASNRERLDFVAGVVAGVSNLGAVGGEGLGDTVTLLGRSVDVSLYDIAAAGAREVQVAKARTFLDNAVAKTWIEQGVVGLVIAGWVAVRLFLHAVRVGRGSHEPDARAVALAFASILAGLAVLWLFLDVPDLFPVNVYFWTFAGLVSGVGTASVPPPPGSHESRRDEWVGPILPPPAYGARESGAHETRDSLAG